MKNTESMEFIIDPNSTYGTGETYQAQTGYIDKYGNEIIRTKEQEMKGNKIFFIIIGLAIAIVLFMIWYEIWKTLIKKSIKEAIEELKKEKII